MDTVIFGDNQFFAINHLSEERARAQSMRFRDLPAVIRVLDDAYALGLRTFMCTTHERIGAVCDHMRANPAAYAGFKIHPCMPYAHKYANAVTELGAVEAIKKFLPGNMLTTIARGGMALAQRDFIGIMKLLVDAEMKMFRGIDTPVIFLQNVVTDLLLGLRMPAFFKAYADYIRDEYKAEAGFITMNLPALVQTLEDCGVENPIVCSSINKLGFRMSGGRAAYERTIAEKRFRPIAMQVLGAGAIPPREAIEYVAGLKNVHSVLFGASSKAHIAQTSELIRELITPA